MHVELLGRARGYISDGDLLAPHVACLQNPTSLTVVTIEAADFPITQMKERG